MSILDLTKVDVVCLYVNGDNKETIIFNFCSPVSSTILPRIGETIELHSSYKYIVKNVKHCYNAAGYTVYIYV